jgi:AbiV family abortive infection protein
MRDAQTIRKAIGLTLDNSRQFLEDAKLLKKSGSIGHATSLAVLGYEEAHKAYLLTFFLPVLEELVDAEYRSKLKTDIKKHEMKHRRAFAFRKGIDLLSNTSASSLLDFILRSPFENLKSSTLFASSINLNRLKNEGLYVDVLSSADIIGPDQVTEGDYVQVKELLESHIGAMKMIVAFYSDELLVIPTDIIEAAKCSKTIIARLVKDPKTSGEAISELRSLGEIGSLIAEIVDAFVRERHKQSAH